MNFKAAISFVKIHCKLLGKRFYIPEIDGKGVINDLIVAPSGKCLEVLQLLAKTEFDNKTVLKKLNIDLQHEEFLVFIIGKDAEDRLYPMTYDVYLKAQDIDVPNFLI